MEEKNVVRTEAAPAPFQGAPYSQGIVAGGFVFVSGQLALRPDHATIEATGVGEQTEQVFANLRAILEAAGSGLEHVVRTNIYVTDPAHWDEVARAQGAVFGETRPAATCVVARLLDDAWKVEIEAEALLP